MNKDPSHDPISCRYCDLPNQTKQVVVSRGSPSAHLMIIGEAPGAQENTLGKPFVGRAGNVLEHLLDIAGINSCRDVYICNVLKCRPPNNRRPTKAEICQSMPWLECQINLVDPHVIILTGATAVEALLRTKQAISFLRGKWQNRKGRLVMPVFHPAYLLRNPSRDEGSPFKLTVNDLLSVKDRVLAIQRASSNRLVERISCKQKK